MDYTLAVCVFERAEYLQRVNTGFLPADGALVVEIFAQGDTVEIFHDDILDIRVNGDIVNAYYILIGKHRNGFRFVDKPCFRGRVSVVFVVEYLYGDNALHYKILGFEHARHAAHSDKLEYFVPAVEYFSYKCIILVHFRIPFVFAAGRGK